MNRTLRLANWRIAILFSSFLPTFNVIVNSQHRMDVTFDRVVVTWPVTFSFLLISWFVNSYLTLFMNKGREAGSWLRRGAVILFCNALLLTLFILCGVYVLKEVNGVIPDIKHAYWLVALKGALSIALIYIIQYALNSNARAQEVSLQNQMLKTENLRSQFEILRQQVNPHFLFNSLSTLRSMIRSGNPNSEEFVIKLSEVYRQLLMKHQKDVVTLKEELEFVNDYSFMLFARFGKMLKISIDLPDRLLLLTLPTFSLQLLLENCIKHNTISTDHPLKIKIFSSMPGTVTVENKMQPKITDPEHSGYGIENLIQRYALLGYADAVFVFTDDEVFRVRLQLLNEESHGAKGAE